MMQRRLANKTIRRALLPLAWLLLAGLSAIGCSQPDGVGEHLRRKLAPKAAGQTSPEAPAEESGAASGTSEASTEGASGQDAADAPASKFRVRTLGLQTTAARRALERNFENFLERESIGFGAGLVKKLRVEGRRLVRRYERLRAQFREATPIEVLRAGVPFLVLALFLAAFFVLTRQFGRLTHRFQSEMHLELSRWATRILRVLLMLSGRVGTVAVLLALSYFPVRAIFGAVPWTELLTLGFWYLLAYRTVASTVEGLLSGRILDVADRHARRLESIGVSAARVVTGFLYAIAALQMLGYPDEFVALLTFAFRVTFVALPTYLYFARDAVLDLLPSEVDSTVYDFFRRSLEQNFRTVMIVTAALFAFRAAGYVRASTFILVRGYAIIGIVAATFALYASIREFLSERVATSPDDDDATPLDGPDSSRLARRLEQLVAIALLFGVTTLALEILLLREPAVILLRIPFVAVGNAEISILTLINVGLIVFGTVLATKLLRALLNSHLYPLFEVDVGVAYAVNTIIKYVLVVTAFFLGLSVLGVDLTAITVVVASLGVGIGFGLQTIVENLISGFILLFGRSVEKGDYITVDGTYGQVEAVGARSVIIKTPDNFEMLIPSKEIVGGRIINWSYEDNTVRGRLEVGVSYNSEPEQVRDVLLETCDTHERVLDEPEPSVRLTEFGDSSINFELLFFFDCRETVERKLIGELNFEVWEALEEAGITIPFPQRDLHVKSDEDWERLKSFVESRREGVPPSDSDPEKEGDDEERDDEETSTDET